MIPRRRLLSLAHGVQELFRDIVERPEHGDRRGRLLGRQAKIRQRGHDIALRAGIRSRHVGDGYVSAEVALAIVAAAPATREFASRIPA